MWTLVIFALIALQVLLALVSPVGLVYLSLAVGALPLTFGEEGPINGALGKFDLSAFRPTTDNTGTYGNAGRGILRNPGQAQADVSLVKNTRFRERFEHQLKFEFFNAFNHPQFSGPGSSIGTASAGVISSLLYNTPMRQIQVAMKVNF